jgi:DMSO/TMAO reductase YedYZ molybdopterin-dependent catalytic subunit
MQPSGAVWRHRAIGASIGLLSAAVAIAVAHLVAAFVDEAASPIAAVGGAVIDLSPPGVKEFAIRTFGSNDKRALVIGISVLLALFAAGMGVLAMRRRWVAYAGLGGFGAIGVVAAMTRPAAGTLSPLPTIAGAVAGLLTLRPLFEAAVGRDVRVATETESVGPDFDRRRFLITGAAFAGVAAAAGIATRFAGAATRRTIASLEALRIPRPSSVARDVSGADLGVAGLSSFRTPNSTFYRVDTALLVPNIEAKDWHLRIHGMVDREITMNMEQLLARPLIERDITLACVSNEIGGHYIGNARWIGAPLKPILEEAGVQKGADQLVSRSADGFTAGTPTAIVMDGRDAMLAVAMNGETLPLKHGFPVRMIVPGLYGYVSATKWLVDMELTTFDKFDAYWISRGWARKAPIKTMSRIDTPRSSADVSAGVVPIAGIAWAQHKGIAKVEVRIDEGPWQHAELGAEDTIDTWRQWVYRWEAKPGSYTIAVRATDKTGYTQTAQERPPIPDGATGWHTVNVNVA